MNRSKRAWLCSALFVAAFALGILFLFGQLKSAANLYDEGLVLVNAERVRAGEAPYRDFWTLYAPGYFYAVAGLFSFVEPSILAARLLDTLLRILLTVEVYLLARTLTSRWVALAPYAFVTFWLGTIRFYSYPAFPATGAILLVALALARYLAVGRSRWLFIAGMALGLTAALRLDFGGYAALGFGLAVALYQVRTTRDSALASKERLLAAVKAESLLAAGALLVAGPLYAYLVAAAGFGTVWNDLVVFPATVFRAYRHLPVPPLIPDFAHLTGGGWNDWLRLYVPLAVYIVAASLALRWLFLRPVPNDLSESVRHPERQESSGDRRLFLGVMFIALTGTGLGLVVKATSRYHELHALPTTICAVILATALVHLIPRKLWRSLPFTVGAAGLAFLFLTGPYVAHFGLLAARGPTSPTQCYTQLARAGCVPIGEDQEQVAEYLRANTRPDEFVFIGNSRHDLIFVNDLLLYFLADRRSPTRYTELHPGLATTLPVQQAIVQDLAEKDVRVVVTLRSWQTREANASSTSSGIIFLDEYIRTHYQPETTFGNYQVWTKKPS